MCQSYAFAFIVSSLVETRRDSSSLRFFEFLPQPYSSFSCLPAKQARVAQIFISSDYAKCFSPRFSKRVRETKPIMEKNNFFRVEGVHNQWIVVQLAVYDRVTAMTASPWEVTQLHPALGKGDQAAFDQ